MTNPQNPRPDRTDNRTDEQKRMDADNGTDNRSAAQKRDDGESPDSHDVPANETPAQRASRLSQNPNETAEQRAARLRR